MSFNKLDSGDYFFGGLLSAFALLVVWALTMMGRLAVVEAHCLEKGYPKAAVTYTYKGYCLNMSGAVTVDVKEIE